MICGLLAASLLSVQPGMTVSAAELTEEEIAAQKLAEEKAAQYEIHADTNSLTGWPQGPDIYAYAGCVMDMESGAILYAKNMDEQMYPASITKLMTVLVALKNSEMTDTVTFTEDSVSFLEWGDAYIGMRPGEEISMEDALYAVLLASANEVSYAVAESTGINRLDGDYSTFIQEMNDMATEIGCTGSSWVNANGLHDENHYTTAHDMAVIASEVYQYDQFRTIMETYEYRIGATNLEEETRVFQQNHKMLWEGNDYSWELATGGKTGYTDQSGTTLVTMAEDGNLKLACVVLKDYGGDAYVDTRAMMEYGFDNFSKVSLAGEELPETIESLKDENAYVLLPEGVDISQVECEVVLNESEQTGVQVKDLTKEEEASLEGTAVFTYEGQIVGETEVVINEELFGEEEQVSNSEDISAVVENQDTIEENKPVLSVGQKALITIAVAVLVCAVAAGCIFYRNYKILQKRKKQRRRRRRERRYMKKHQ